MSASLRLSVGIPTYNQADFLEQTILSLLSQTRRPDEIVISDHYSTDRTPEIIQKYAAHVRAVMPPQGTNLTGQYNFTLSSQTGDWITLLSSDDIAYPHYCEVLANAAASRSDAVAVRTGWENIDANGKVLSHQYMLSAPKVEQPPSTVISQKNGPRISFASFALRREAYLRSGPILASIESLADWALFVQIAPFGSFVYAHELASGYRIGHDGNKFRNRLGMWIRDEQRMFTDVFPLAADRAGMSSPEQRSWIAEASSQNFLRYLQAAEQEFSPAERAETALLFTSWAQQTGNTALLHSFATNEPIRWPVNRVAKMKSIIRPWVQKAHALMHAR